MTARRHTEGKTEDPGTLSRKPANYTPTIILCAADMLVCTHRRFLIVLFQREKGLDLEAHLSAEDPPPCARAWISLAHENDWRSSRARRAPRARA
jgi:hypothetical protein